MNNDCLYCNKNQTQKDLMIEVCELEVSTVYLFREQTYRGRCIVAYADHNIELYELEGLGLLTYMEDVNRVAEAIKEIFNPIKINYGAYSDKLPHLHMHLVPKYVDGPDYGSTFAMNPQKIYLSDAEYAEMVNQLRNKLKKNE